MSKAVKKSLVKELKEADEDFVLIENTSSEVVPLEDHLEISRETNTCVVNIAQHDTNTESSSTAEEYRPEYTENLKALPLEKEVYVDQKYWEQNGTVTKRESNSQLKYPASQRMTVTELNKIAMYKTVSRDPSYYKFNISTTETLQTLIDKKIVGSYHNVLGKGHSSVVIHAHYTEPYNIHGMAVKVYKLSNDVKKNKAILKHAQREYEHLKILRNCPVPHICHRLKNVVVFGMLGNDQEPFPSLSSLPSEYSERVYKSIVEEIEKWYTQFGIVHGKLCSKNIMYDTTVYPYYYRYEKFPCRPYVISWGHSVKRDHPQALMKLMRDCHFVTNFFRNRDVAVKSTRDLFKDVTGLEQISCEVLDAMYKKDLWREGHLTNPNRL